MREYVVANMLICPLWMGKYPRKGADWSPEEDAALMRAYESGRYLNKELAAFHMREPVAIERRLGVLRNYRAWDEARKNRGARLMLDEGVFGGTPGGGKTWASEREAAQRAVSGIKATFASTMWPGERDKTFSEPPRQRGVKPGTLFRGSAPCIAVACPRGTRLVALTDLPPEVAQALQFGQGEES